MEYTPELIEKLNRLEIFSDLKITKPEHEELLKKVCELLEPVKFSEGDVIIKEGEEGNSLYILYEGSVQVRRNTPSNDQFAVVNLTTEQNVFFGEVALVDKDTRSASVMHLLNAIH